MTLIDRISGLLDDRNIEEGQLRVIVNEISGKINIIISPGSILPDHYEIITVEDY
jgi:hypothetical protein